MRPITFAAVTLAALAAASAAPAQAQTQPGDGSLVFNPDQRQWALRTAGLPQLCTAGASCVPIQFDGVAPAQIATAEIAGLGFSGGTYYLALRHAEIAGGRQQAFRCVAEVCAPSEMPPGDFASLGTYTVTLQGLLQGGLQTRTAILARAADAPERSRLFVCADRACTEQAFTRDNAADLAFVGAAATDGRNRLWLRERRGTVFGCAPAEGSGEDRLDCRPTAMSFPAGEDSLVFNPEMRQWANRAAGVPNFCMAGGRCGAIRFDRVSAGQIAAAEITPLGFAGGTYYLALRHPEIDGGRQQAYRCAAEACVVAAGLSGDFAFLGTHSLTLQGLLQSRTVFLARAANAPDRSRLISCSDKACTEQALTRDNAYDLGFMGAAPADGRSRLWLRARNGAVFGCAPSETAGQDRLDCTPTAMNFPDAAAPTAADTTGADAQALTVAIEDAIRRGNWAEADRLIAEAKSRFPGQPNWAAFERRLTQLRANRDNNARIAQARRLVADARRYANAGDFRTAEAVLQEAAALAPGLADIAQARAEIARLRAERSQRFRERSQFVAAIEGALGAFRLWEAEGLIGEALARFPNDPDFRNFERRVGQMRLQAEWQGRLRRAERLVAQARDAMRREQWDEAERHLDAAEALAMGLPDIRAARADLRRLSAEADARATEIRQITIDIEAFLVRKDIARAERMLDFAVRRFPAHPGWADLRRRVAAAKAAVPPPATATLIAQAQTFIAQKNWPQANRLIVDAERLDPTAPSVRAARKNLDDARLAAFTEARRHVADGDAAVARKDWPAADRATDAAEKADPFNPTVQAAVRKLRSDIAAGKGAGPAPGSAAIAAAIAAADAAMAKKDWVAANREVVKAEAINRTDRAVIAARKRLDDARSAALAEARRHIADGNAAVTRRDWPAAERAADAAEKADPLNPAMQAAVKKLRDDVAKGKSTPPPLPPGLSPVATALTAADAAMAKKDWASANREIVKAEAIDPKSPAVIAARKKLDGARLAALQQARKFIADGDAAVKAKNWPVAEKAAADAANADPLNPTVQAAVKKLRDDIAAGKAAGPAPGATAPLIAAANAAMAKKDWASANREIVKAEAIDPKSPAVIAARKRLDDARLAALQQARKFIADGDAAVKAKNWPVAEKAAADAANADPLNPTVQAAVKKLRDDIAKGKTAGPAPGATAPLIAAANAAIASKNWPVAESNIAKAEAINRADPAVMAARKRLDDSRNAAFALAKKLIDDGNAAGRARNWPAAEKAADDAERADPFNPTVRGLAKKLRDDIAKAKAAGPAPGATAPLIAAANTAMASKNWPVAESNIVKAEAINRADPAVVAARNKLNADRAAAEAAALPFARACDAAIKANNKAVADSNRDQVKARDPFGRVATILKGQYAAKGWPW